MKPNWIPVHRNLADAQGELASLVVCVQYAAFGKVFDEGLKNWEEWALEEKRNEPLAEGGLFRSINYIFKHLNRAWNGRNASMETVARRERHDVSRWERFPTHTIFRDLRSALNGWRGKPSFIGSSAAIDSKAIHPHLQYAWRKLERLCELTEAAADAQTTEGTSKPSCNSPPLAEADFGRRLHRIYAELDYAWSIRRPRRGHAGKPTCERQS